MEEQLRDTRSILRHGKHIEELQKEKDYYLKECQTISEESYELAEKIKIFSMSPIEQRTYFIKKKKNFVILSSLFGIGFYNLIICGVINYSLKFYFTLLCFNILFLYICMTKYNKIIDEKFIPLVFSEEDKQAVYQRFNQIGDEFDGEYFKALANYEDVCRKLKKLGVE
jgi:hypothetical protein